MTLSAWEHALTQMEDELDEHEAAVRTGDAVLVPAWQPPCELGPMPPQCAARVANLVKRIGLLSTFVQFQLVAAQKDLEHLQRKGTPEMGSTNRAVALFLDASV